MWDLSSLTRDQTCVPCIGRRILYHWTTREVPLALVLLSISVMTNDVGRLFMCICTSSENTSDSLGLGDTRIAQGPQELPTVI